MNFQYTLFDFANTFLSSHGVTKTVQRKKIIIN